MTAELSIKQQDSILDSTHRINLWHGSARAGKTIASCISWLEFVRTAPPGPLALLGKTKDTIARNVQDVIADIAPGTIAYTRGSNVCRILGRQLEVIGANDAKAESKIRGLTLAGCYLDEATLVPEAFFRQALNRMSVPGARMYATTNPDNPQHWLKREFMDKAAKLEPTDPKRPDLIAFHFQLADNPSLEEEFIRNLKAEHSGVWYDRFVLGLWVAGEGAIYPQLNLEVHNRKAPHRSRWQAAWIGIDYGTSNPTHCVLIVLAADERGELALWVVAEWQHDGRKKGSLTDATISKRAAEWAGPLLENTGLSPITVLDPSAASLRTQMRADGWPGLRSADNRVLPGIQAVSSLLGRPRLFIDRDACPVLWAQLEGYRWDETASNRGEDKPIKEDDHGPDALRYGIMAARMAWRPWLPDLAEAAALTAA